MKLATWNVNSLKVRLPQVLDWLAAVQPDVLCLQELKLEDKAFPLAEIEAAGCTDTATTRCQVVTLYGGGQYKLYTYRKYSDVRIVWAPESRAQQFAEFDQHFIGGRRFARAHQNGNRIERVKKKMRLQLHLQSVEPRFRQTRFELRRTKRELRRLALAFDVATIYLAQRPNADQNKINQQIDMIFADKNFSKIFGKIKNLLRIA